jgi:hypothetical protein
MKWKLPITIALLSITPAAYCGGTYVGMVKPLHYGNGGLYLEISATQVSNRPACAVRSVVRLQEAQTDQAYKDKFAILLGAWFTDRPVYLAGTGSCTSEGDEIISVVTFP